MGKITLKTIGINNKSYNLDQGSSSVVDCIVAYDDTMKRGLYVFMYQQQPRPIYRSRGQCSGRIKSHASSQKNKKNPMPIYHSRGKIV